MFFAACKKELSLENAQNENPVPPPPPPPPPPVKQTHKYQLKAFYSDIPIDFDETDDIVKSETDLWAYVYDYVKDDVNEFTDDSKELLIYQGEIKYPGNDSTVLQRTYFIGNDEEGQYMRFLSPEYEALRYRLLEIDDEHFIIYLKWKHGSTVYSRFERVD
jgi:hypothetical protein